MSEWSGPQGVAAICVVLTMLAGFFLFMVRMILKADTQQAIRTAVNGFSVRVAVLEAQMATQTAEIGKLRATVHSYQPEVIAGVQREAFRMGQEMRRDQA